MRTEHAHILIDRAVVEQVESFKFHGIHITSKLTWSKHNKSRRGHYNTFPIRSLKRFGMGPQILKTLYSSTIESILTGCITAWFGSCSASDRKALQRVVRMAQYITGSEPLYKAVSEGGPKYCQRLQSPIDCSPCYSTVSGTKALSLGPKGSLTASTPKP